MYLSLLLDGKLLKGGDYIYFNFIFLSVFSIMLCTVCPQEILFHWMKRLCFYVHFTLIVFP